MRCEKFKGVGVALVTPFADNGDIDYQALRRHIDYLIGAKVDFLAICGTTGEPATMTFEEKNKFKSAVVEFVDGKMPIMYGLGGNNTNEIINEIKNTDFNGIDAILSISPYYTKPSQSGIYQHFKAISQASPLPVVLYNVPGRTSMNVNADTVCKIARDFKNVVAIKEASGNMAQIMQILKNKPEDFAVYSGDDSLTLPMAALGATAVISVIANVLPKQFVQMGNFCFNGNFTEAAKLHFDLLDIMNAMFEDGSPAGAKCALNELGIMKENLRLPLVPVNLQTGEKIKSLLKNFK